MAVRWVSEFWAKTMLLETGMCHELSISVCYPVTELHFFPLCQPCRFAPMCPTPHSNPGLLLRSSWKLPCHHKDSSRTPSLLCTSRLHTYMQPLSLRVVGWRARDVPLT